MDDSITDRSGVADMLGVTTRTLDRLRTADTTFPQPIRLTAHTLRWRTADIYRWLADKGDQAQAPARPRTGRRAKSAEELYR